ncbi:MAG: hypothetical protein P3W93_008835 [Thermus sp.]|nr:hypothetical protein [Thermus sp.]
MVKVDVALLWARVGAVERPAVHEALEALRRAWKEESVRELLTEAAKGGYTLVNTKDIPPEFVAAVKVALKRLRERLGKAPSQPSTKVWVDESKREGRKAKVQSWDWKSPEGVTYKVYPYDLPPKGEYWGFRDQRVEEAWEWVQSFLSTAEVEEGPSPLEEAIANEDNAHFSRELPASLENGLRRIGWNGSLKELTALVDSLPAKEKEFEEALESIPALVDPKTKEEVARRVAAGWEVFVVTEDLVMALMGLRQATNLVKTDWSVPDMRAHLAKVFRYAPKLERLLDTIAVLRQAAHYLEELGRPRHRVVAYRDPATGEVVLRSPVIE